MHNPLDPMVILATLLYTGIGVLVFLGVFVAMVKLAPFSVRKEIEEDQNTALAVLMGSVFLGLALIISAAIRGG